MAGGWTPYWKSHDPDDPPWIIVMPEYKPAELDLPPPPRVRSGLRAQQYFTFYTTHKAGIYQRVPVETGRQYCFCGWGHSWSSSDDDPQTSDSPLIQKIGIDPYGGDNWESENIVWGPVQEQYNAYGLFAVCTVAMADQITVLTYSEPIWAVKHNDVYWDDAELTLYEHDLEIPQIDGIRFLADVNDPRLMSQTITINIPDDPWVTWHAEVEDGGSVDISLNRTSGGFGDDLIVTVNSSGMPVGTFLGGVTISTTPELSGSPSTVPVTLVVAPEIYFNGLPYLER
jgi:hypothetical protein